MRVSTQTWSAVVEVHGRTAAVYLAIRQAAAVDGDAAELEQTLADERFSGYRKAAGELARRGALPPARTPDHAAATIWTLGHPDTYRYLRHRRGWSADRYRRWVSGQLSAAIRHNCDR